MSGSPRYLIAGDEIKHEGRWRKIIWATDMSMFRSGHGVHGHMEVKLEPIPPDCKEESINWDFYGIDYVWVEARRQVG